MGRITRTLGSLCLWISVSLLLVTVFTVLCQVAFRYVFNLPLAWTEEASRLALIGSVYAALPAAYLKGEHIVVDFFVGLLPERILRLYVMVLKAVCALVVSYFALGAFLQAGSTRNMTFISLPTLPVASIYLLQGVMMTCFALVIVLTWSDLRVYVPPGAEQGDNR